MDYVYVIHAEGTNMYKIGRSEQPMKRLSSLETGMPYKLRIFRLYKTEQASVIESKLHLYLRDRQVKLEWFDLTFEDIERLDFALQFLRSNYVFSDTVVLENYEVEKVFDKGTKEGNFTKEQIEIAKSVIEADRDISARALAKILGWGDGAGTHNQKAQRLRKYIVDTFFSIEQEIIKNEG